MDRFLGMGFKRLYPTFYPTALPFITISRFHLKVKVSAVNTECEIFSPEFAQFAPIRLHPFLSWIQSYTGESFSDQTGWKRNTVLKVFTNHSFFSSLTKQSLGSFAKRARRLEQAEQISPQGQTWCRRSDCS